MDIEETLLEETLLARGSAASAIEPRRQNGRKPVLETKMVMQARFVQRLHFGHSRRAGLTSRAHARRLPRSRLQRGRYRATFGIPPQSQLACGFLRAAALAPMECQRNRG
jgi:hypothetical protein